MISSARLHRLPDQTVLDAYEHRPELRRVQSAAWLLQTPYAMETARALQELNVATLCPAPLLRAWNCSRCRSSSFGFLPNETHVVEVGTRNSLLAVVAPDHRRLWVVVALRGTIDSIVLD